MQNNNGESLVIKGEIAGTHPAKLLFRIIKGRKSGVLTFDDSVTKLRLFFKDGRIIDYFDGIKIDKNFRRYLVRNKKVTADELKTARKNAKKEKKNTIELLIEKNILDRFEAESDASEFYWKTVPGAFSWRHGTFSFKDKKMAKHPGKPEVSKTLNLILNGIIDKYNYRMIEQRLKKRMKTKILVNKNSKFTIEDIDLNENQKAFIDNLVAGMPLIKALGAAKLPHSEAIALAFTTLTFEILKFKSKPRKAPPKVKKKTALDIAMEEAGKSVDKIKKRVSEERAAEAESIAAGFKSVSEEELQGKLQEMYKEGEPEVKGEDQIEGESSFDFEKDADDGESYADFEGDENSFGEDFSQDGAEGDEEFSSDEEDYGFGDISDEYEEGEEGTGDFGDLDSFENEPEELSFNPDDTAQDVFKLGIIYEEQGAYETAVKAYDEAISRGFESLEATCRKGWATYNSDPDSGGFDRGAAVLQEVIKQDPNSFYSYLYLGKIYEAEADLSMAELYYIKALELNRECEEAKNSIKRLYEDK